MQKIIAAFDGLKYSDSTANYSIWLADQIAGKLTGVFLEDPTYHSFKLSDIVDSDGAGYEQQIASRIERDRSDRSNAVHHFTKACTEAGLTAVVHRDRNIAIKEMLHETLFSDLVVIQNNETLTHYTEQPPTNFITQLLEHSECPVILVPNYFHVPEKIVFLYDGSPSSVFAAKHFTYLLDKVKIPVQVICDLSRKQEKDMPEKNLFFEWLQHHFEKFDYKVLRGAADEEITDELRREFKQCLVVMGAYGRSFVSRAIRPSLADLIIRKLNIPVFVSHK